MIAEYCRVSRQMSKAALQMDSCFGLLEEWRGKEVSLARKSNRRFAFTPKSVSRKHLLWLIE